MNLQSIRYFTVLAEELHFGRAAERLAITQPPLSQAIKGLETELGAQLLLRTSKHVELTPAGAAFLDEARQVLARLANARTAVRAVTRGVRGRLDVGMTGSLIYRGVPAIVQALGRAMPGIEVTLRERSTAEQVQDLLHGQLDAGFINAPAAPPRLASLPLGDDEFVLALPDTHALARARKVDLRRFAEEPFVMFARDVSPANYDNVIAVFSHAGFHPRIVHAARQWLTVLAMVANGLGVALVPRAIAQSRLAGVTFVRFDGAVIPAPALLVWNPARMSPALQGLIDCALASLTARRKGKKPQRRRAA